MFPYVYPQPYLGRPFGVGGSVAGHFTITQPGTTTSGGGGSSVATLGPEHFGHTTNGGGQ